MRQVHRWLSMAFTAGVVVNFAVIGAGETEPAFWVYLLALVPLFGLLATGLYLFVLPHAMRWRGGRPAGAAE